jgi:multicomponent Na+:H+ antiporter subunit D
VSALVTLPFALPLLGAGACVLAWKVRWLQRVVAFAVLLATVTLTIALLVRVDADGTAAVQLGGWPVPLGISYVADRTSALLLAVAHVVLLAVLVYAEGQPRGHPGPAFHPVYLVLAAGVSAAFLTGDLFHLFVAFELMLSASYVLLTIGGRPDQVRSGMTYVVISLLASLLLLMAIAFVYAATGTVNMAELATRMAELDPGLQQALAVLLLLTFGIKAALFPLFFWLPDAYPTAPSPVTALFAGLLTKVAVYVLIRTQTLFFAPEIRPATLILLIAGLTMTVGVLGAIAQSEVKRLLSFHIVSQIGYVVMGLGFFTVAGLAGAVFFVANQIVIKTTLFLTGGLVEHAAGSGRLARIGGLLHRSPVLAACWLLPALSLAGVPPFSGFPAKLALVQAGFTIEEWTVVGVSLAVSLFTLYSMSKVWAGAFWGEVEIDPDGDAHRVSRLGGPALMVWPTIAMVGIGVAFAVWAGPIYRLCERAATDLLDPTAYLQAVLG